MEGHELEFTRHKGSRMTGEIIFLVISMESAMAINKMVSLIVKNSGVIFLVGNKKVKNRLAAE